MGYIEYYVHTKAGAELHAASPKTYDLPWLKVEMPMPGRIESYKMEFNRTLKEYRRTREDLNSNMPGVYTKAERKKQLLSLEAHMQKLLVKIGSYSDEEVKGGFHVGESQCAP
jgi:hypothetical protein